MVQINFATREVSCKIVYYGPGLCGKTTNLQQVHAKAPTELRGHLTSIATEGDRTLFFDFMPLELGTVAGMRTKLQLYTVPGQVYYNATRKIVLEGVDGIIFVADSSPARRQANRDSWLNLKENLREYGLDVRDIPLVLQFNKRDLPDAVAAAELEAELNELGAPTFEAVAVNGEGVMATLRQLAAMVLERLNEQPSRRSRRQPAPAPAGASPQGGVPAGAAAAAVPVTPAARAATTAAAAAAAAAATTGRETGPAPSERRADRMAEPTVARPASSVEHPASPAAAKPEPEGGRPAPAAIPPRGTGPKPTDSRVHGAPALRAGTRPGPPAGAPKGRSEARVSPPGVAGEKAPGGDSTAAAPGVPRAGAVSAGKPAAGRPGSRARFTLAEHGRKTPSGKKELVIIGVLAIVVVVLLVLLVWGR